MKILGLILRCMCYNTFLDPEFALSVELKFFINPLKTCTNVKFLGKYGI